MDQLPINIDLRGKKVVVTGGGTVSARKAELALRAGARVLAVARDLSAEFDELGPRGMLEHRRGVPEPGDFAGAVLVFAASEERAEDERVVGMARDAGALVNVPDRPSLCDFSMPAIVDRSPLLVAISTAGNSPLLARLLKERLESSIPATYGKLARFLGGIRTEVASRIGENRQRRRFLERLADGPIADKVLQGDEAGAQAMLASALDKEAGAGPGARIGEVYVVGGGPGDPDLLTFRALRLMQRADVVVYDRLLGSPIMELVRRDAERIYVGKKRGNHELSQDEIGGLMVRLAREGKRVLRLKGGDPFMFGRGGEELELLAAAGIPFQVVPGVTAALGAASYAGIPLTHRDHAQSCVFVTGHARGGRIVLDWTTLLRPQQTVVIYMGLAMLADLMRDMIANGAEPNLPVAVVDNATRPSQTVVTGTVTTIAERVGATALKGPAVIIVGTVVELRDRLSPRHPIAGNSAAAVANMAHLESPDMRSRRIEDLFKAIDAANADDPRQTLDRGEHRPYEVLYAERMSRRLAAMYPEASEALQIAARAQHIRRWEIPRTRYPEGRAGYNDWRKAARDHHGRVVGDLMRERGYRDHEIDRVAGLIAKEQLKKDRESQALENVVAVVFIEHYLDEFLAKYDGFDDDKIVDILGKTLRKMSPKGHETALALDLSECNRKLVMAAVAREAATLAKLAKVAID